MTDDEDRALISRAQAGEIDAPELATCSYWEYRRGTGTATMITRMAPRGQALPNPRWTDNKRWPAARLLAPGHDYFHRDLPPAEFRARYLEDLNRLGVPRIAAALREVTVEDGRLVLLCYESVSAVTAEPAKCHRRVFAEWWTERTGRVVPELTAAVAAEIPGQMMIT
jgi:hypothetical protein